MTIMTMCCMQACVLNSLVDYFSVKTHDIWEGNMITRRNFETEHNRSWVSGYKRGSDIIGNDIMEVRVYTLFCLERPSLGLVETLRD